MHSLRRQVTRLLSTQPRPWFVDLEPALSVRQPPPHLVPKTLPPNLPEPIRQLYTRLGQSPLLEPSLLDVCQHVAPPPGPPLPRRAPQGRRRRGGTYCGEGIEVDQGGIWDWVVLAQVKDGTENRGSIEAVVRLVRKTLLTMDPPVLLPPNSKRRGYNGWAMIDAGNFVVHVLSQDARQKYFEHTNHW
ncbi:hypothetical protein V8B97DRAFT_1938469 [Scleroderma yunnanense]